MKFSISFVLPMLLVTTLTVQAGETNPSTAAASAEIRKTVLIQQNGSSTRTVADSEAARSQSNGKHNRKFRFLQATRHVLENIIISEQKPVFTDSEYVASNELCTYNRAAYTYTCH